MEKKLDLMKKLKEVKKKKRLNNNKGFSLIELLIVIAIMGVLAVIAFNMFGGVLQNSKRRADDQQAQILQKAILTYCVDSNDWALDGGTGTTLDTDGNGSTAIYTINTTTSTAFIGSLLKTITYKHKEYGPMLSPKDPTIENDTFDANSPNVKAFDPQWNPSVGGKNEGYKIDVYPEKQSVVVVPAPAAESKVAVHVTSEE